MSCSPSTASHPSMGSKGSITPVWSGPFQQLLPEHRAMQRTQETSPGMIWASTLHSTSHGAAHEVLEVLGAGTRTLPSLLQPRSCLRGSVPLTKPQPLFLQLLHQSRACSFKSHHMPWHQEPWVRMGPPGCSVLMDKLRSWASITQLRCPWPQPCPPSLPGTSPTHSPLF